MTDPGGSDFLFAFGLSLWSWRSHIPAAMLWLLRSSSNGLQFTLFRERFYHLVSLDTHCNLKASWESKQRTLLLCSPWNLPRPFGRHQLCLRGFHVPQISLLKWAHPSIIQLLIWLLMAVPLSQNGLVFDSSYAGAWLQHKRGPALATLAILAALLISCSLH